MEAPLFPSTFKALLQVYHGMTAHLRIFWQSPKSLEQIQGERSIINDELENVVFFFHCVSYPGSGLSARGCQEPADAVSRKLAHNSLRGYQS
jgi:hypothetical protein